MAVRVRAGWDRLQDSLRISLGRLRRQRPGPAMQCGCGWCGPAPPPEPSGYLCPECGGPLATSADTLPVPRGGATATPAAEPRAHRRAQSTPAERGATPAETLRARCSVCGFENTVPGRFAGSTRPCANCDAPTPVPLQEDAEPLEASDADDSLATHLAALRAPPELRTVCPVCGYEGSASEDEAGDRIKCMGCGAFYSTHEVHKKDVLEERLMGGRPQAPPPPGQVSLGQRRRIRATVRRVVRIGVGLTLCTAGLVLRALEPGGPGPMRRARIARLPTEAQLLLLEARIVVLTPAGLRQVDAQVTRMRREARFFRSRPADHPNRRAARERTRLALREVSPAERAWLGEVVRAVHVDVPEEPPPLDTFLVPREAEDAPPPDQPVSPGRDVSLLRRVAGHVAQVSRKAVFGRPAYAQDLTEEEVAALLADLLASLSDAELATVEAVVEEALLLLTGEDTLTADELTLLEQMAREARALGAQFAAIQMAVEFDLPLKLVRNAVTRVAMTGVPSRDLNAYARSALGLSVALAGRGLQTQDPEAVAMLEAVVDATGHAKSVWLSLTYWEHTQHLDTTAVAVSRRCSMTVPEAMILVSAEILATPVGAPLTDSPPDVEESPDRQAQLEQAPSWYAQLGDALLCPP